MNISHKGRPARELVARLRDGDVDTLERRLTLAASKVAPGAHRGKKAPAGAGNDEDYDEIIQEIVDTARGGVNIAPFTESLPILPAYAAADIELPVPLKVQHEQMGYTFYFVQVTFSSGLAPDQFPLSAELAIEIEDDIADPARGIRPIAFFPARKDVDMFKASIEGGVTLDANMNLGTLVDGKELVPFAKAKADAALKAGVALGPLRFQFRRAEIEVEGGGDNRVRWRYNFPDALMGAQDIQSMLVLKVAQEARELQLDSCVVMVPCKRRWFVFKDELPELSDREVLPVELVPH